MLHDIIFPVSSTTRSSSRRKNGNASESFAVATGSTNFSLGGLYIQNNNVLLFRDADVASFYANVFAAAFPNATGFFCQADREAMVRKEVAACWDLPLLFLAA